MKLKTFSMALRLLVVTMAFLPTALHQNAARAQESGPGQPSMEEMMKKWEEMAAPGNAHKLLDQFVGTWDVTTKFWMEGPDKPPMESKATCVAKWILGGRFLQDDVTGEMMGKPFQGIGITGYDNFNKKYVSFWADNSSTAFFTSEGAYNPVEKILSFYGLMDDPSMDVRDKPVLYINRLISDKKHVMEIHDLEIGGARTKVGEMVYTRK